MENWIYRLILGIVFFVPISSFISVRLLFVTLLLALIYHKGNNLLRTSWDIIIYLVILLGGLTYSVNLDTGFKVLETSFSFLAIPIVFSRIQILTERKMNQIFYSFILGLTVTCFICLANAILSFSNSGDISLFFFYELTGILNLHPTYFAYYLIFAITYALYFLYCQRGSIHPILISVTIAFFFGMLMLTGGRTSFISLLFVFSFFILQFFLAKSTKEQQLTFVLVLVMMIFIFLISSFGHNDRQEILNDSWDRFTLWKSAIAANPNFIFGVGTGDYKVVLNEYYETHQMKSFASTSLNSHNQFLQILFSNGIMGLLSLVLLIAHPLYLAFKRDHSLGILVFFPFIIYGMTEVFLGRYQGVVFFALLHQIFATYYQTLRSPNFLNDV